jgi:hypothetical protein
MHPECSHRVLWKVPGKGRIPRVLAQNRRVQAGAYASDAWQAVGRQGMPTYTHKMQVLRACTPICTPLFAAHHAAGT